MSLWNSLERIDVVFHRARMTAIASGVIAAAGWIWPAPQVAAPATFVTATAIVIALFTWFRRDDLSKRT